MVVVDGKLILLREKLKIFLGGVFNQQQIFLAAADSATPLSATGGGSGIKPTPSGPSR
jgi:hypothetical protein